MYEIFLYIKSFEFLVDGFREKVCFFIDIVIYRLLREEFFWIGKELFNLLFFRNLNKGNKVYF